MIHGMKIINQKLCVSKEFGFAEHAVGAERACEVIYDDFRWSLPPGEEGQKHIVAAFALRDAVAEAMDSPFSNALLPDRNKKSGTAITKRPLKRLNCC